MAQRIAPKEKETRNKRALDQSTGLQDINQLYSLEHTIDASIENTF